MVRIPLTDARGETGKTGLAVWNGQVSESYTHKLEWPSAFSVYDEMRRRDPTIRTMWNAMVMLARTANWYFEPESEEAEDAAAAEFLNDAIEDMSQTVDDAIEDALTCVLFGWSWLELVYKRRDDGRIGWKKWAVRRQSSFHKWRFDEEGGLQGLVQRPAPDYEEIEIPIQKSLHFTFQRDGGNPEGWALLESLYETWYYLKNLQIINGIGWQRTFVGLPVFRFLEKPSAEDKTQVERTGEALTVDAKQYVSVPEKVEFSLESTANANASTLLDTIKYYRLLMLQSMLADFINLGSGEVGSFALGSDKSQLFLMAVDGMLDRLAGIVNRFAVPRLLEYNAGITGSARLVHSKVEKPNIAALGEWLQQVSALLTWTPEDENWLRQRMEMPQVSEEVEEEPPEEEELPDELEERFAAVELAEQGRSRQRATIENELAGDIDDFLDEQEKRVLDLVKRDPALADNAAFWEDEQERFRKRFLGRLTKAAQNLARMATDDVRESVGGGADWAGVNTEAAQWARKYVGKLIGNVTDTTKKGVREAVANWVETGAKLPDLVDSLAPQFGKQRAELIASTEVTRTYDEANDLTRQSVGLPAT